MKRLSCILTVLLIVLTALAQAPTPATIHGIVVDEQGEPLIGASLLLKGSGQGAVTDADGRFVLPSAGQDDVVTISYVGYQPVTMALAQLAKAGRVRLTPDKALQVEEVVVTGMQRMDKRLFTGATTQLKAEDTKIDGLADISRSLEGRAAGVSVQNLTGTFGTAPRIRVRGATSIYGSSKPLWVVDGVIIDDVSDISADDGTIASKWRIHGQLSHMSISFNIPGHAAQSATASIPSAVARLPERVTCEIPSASPSHASA